MKGPKILIYDIESSHNALLNFDLGGKNAGYIPHHNILEERYIICISWRWYGQKKIHSVSILDDPKRFKKNHHDDYHVVSVFRDVLEEAEALVAHNGDRFDLPMIKARMIFHGIPPIPKCISLDTLKMARRSFKFNSNSLDYLARFLGFKGKMDNPKGLWINCWQGDVKAIKHMIKYNKVDIEILEFVFVKLLPYIDTYAINLNMFLKGARCPNPTCGSSKLEWRGHKYTKTAKYRRCVCKECGTWSNERTALKEENKITIVK